jgi:hypothetical protein
LKVKDRETEAKKAMNKMFHNSVSKGKMEEKLKVNYNWKIGYIFYSLYKLYIGVSF